MAFIFMQNANSHLPNPRRSKLVAFIYFSKWMFIIRLLIAHIFGAYQMNIRMNLENCAQL